MPVLFDGPLMAEYHQFYVSDAASLTTLPTQWTEQDVERRILAGEHGVIISTARNMPVAVRVELHAHQPALDPARVDHAVTASFRSTGSITIAGLLDYAPAAATASVPPGTLCAMAVSTGLGTISMDGLEGQDRYTVHLWPCTPRGVTVQQQRTEPSAPE